jgi:integrase
MLKLDQRHGANFYARGTYLGITIEKSLGVRDRGQAELLLAKLQKEIFDQNLRGGRAVRRIEGFREAALNYMKSGRTRRYLAPLILQFGDMPINQIDQQMIDRVAEILCPTGGPATRNRAVYTPLSAVLKFAGVQAKIRSLKEPRGVIRWITPTEAGRLLEKCSPHLRPLVTFLLGTGARAGEALWLEWKDVDLARAHVSFLKTKNGRARGVPLHPAVVAALANLPHREGLVFRRPDGKPYIRSGEPGESAGSKIREAFQGACKRAGIQNFRVHDCRHTWATWFYASTHDLIALQQLGGWSDLGMVSVYAHSNSEEFQLGIAQLPLLRA